MDGMDRVQANIAALRNRMIAAAAAAGDESALLLSSYAKANAPWTDQTGVLRGSIKGESEVSGSTVVVRISENTTYAPYVEAGTSRSRAFPALWPAVANNTTDVLGIFKRHMQL